LLPSAYLDGPLVMSLILASVFTAAFCGLIPASQLRRLRLGAGLKGEASGRRGTRQRQILVTVQVAASTLVLIGAGLFVRTVFALQATTAGSDPDKMLLLALSPKNAGRSDPQARTFFRDAREAVTRLPGVTHATYSMVRAMTGTSLRMPLVIEGGIPVDQAALPARQVIGPEYFATFGIPILAGRDFAASDDANAPKVAIISQRFAEIHFPGQDPLGRRIGPNRPDYTIVGIARDSQHAHAREPAVASWYIPYEQFPASKYLDLCVRTTGSAEFMLPAIRRALAGVDSGVAQFEVRTQRRELERLLRSERALAWLASAFGGITAVLAGTGLFGLLAFVVARRQREIGIRMALGATPGSVVRGVLRHGAGLAVLGLTAGLIGSSALMPLIRHGIFGVSPADPLVLAFVISAVASTAALASWLPARRAARVDPAVALRSE
jgi:predicted permease